jgi:hypothetical protein
MLANASDVTIIHSSDKNNIDTSNSSIKSSINITTSTRNSSNNSNSNNNNYNINNNINNNRNNNNNNNNNINNNSNNNSNNNKNNNSNNNNNNSINNSSNNRVIYKVRQILVKRVFIPSSCVTSVDQFVNINITGVVVCKMLNDNQCSLILRDMVSCDIILVYIDDINYIIDILGISIGNILNIYNCTLHSPINGRYRYLTCRGNFPKIGMILY